MQTWYFSDEYPYCKLTDAAWGQKTQLRICTNIHKIWSLHKRKLYRWQQTIESPGHQHQHHHHSGWGELLQQYLETADQGPVIRCRSCNQNLCWKRNMHNCTSTCVLLQYHPIYVLRAWKLLPHPKSPNRKIHEQTVGLWKQILSGCWV